MGPVVSAANINVGNIVPSPRNPKANSLNMQFGVFQCNINQNNPVPRFPGFFHDRYCPMARKSCFPRETQAGSEEDLAAKDGPSCGGNCSTRRLNRINTSRYRVRVD